MKWTYNFKKSISDIAFSIVFFLVIEIVGISFIIISNNNDSRYSSACRIICGILLLFSIAAIIINYIQFKMYQWLLKWIIKISDVGSLDAFKIARGLTPSLLILYNPKYYAYGFEMIDNFVMACKNNNQIRDDFFIFYKLEVAKIRVINMNLKCDNSKEMLRFISNIQNCFVNSERNKNNEK